MNHLSDDERNPLSATPRPNASFMGTQLREAKS